MLEILWSAYVILYVYLSLHVQLQHEAYWNFILQNFMKTCWTNLIVFVADNFNCLTRQSTRVGVCMRLFYTVTLRITCSVHMHYTLYHLNSVCQKWKSQHCCNQAQWELHTDCSTAVMFPDELIPCNGCAMCTFCNLLHQHHYFSTSAHISGPQWVGWESHKPSSYTWLVQCV